MNHNNYIKSNPDPCTENVHIEFNDEAKDYNLFVYNISGQSIKSFNSPVVNWDLTDNTGTKVAKGQNFIRDSKSNYFFRLIVK